MPERTELIAKAMRSVEEATPAAQADPTRPVYHFMPPALWMNDPNGLIHHNGWYHIFYQHNPYGSDWGHMHWGHGRSRDLVHWEHLPIALWPSKSKGEQHCYSGCALEAPDGKVIAFYTSIPNEDGSSAKFFSDQWVAVAEDDDLATWRKHEKNPILAPEIHGDLKVYDWRDPFVFTHGGTTYMALGGNVKGDDTQVPVVCYYKAKNDDLTEWEYLGPLFTEDGSKLPNIECPNFLKFGDTWVLLTSPHKTVGCYTGTFDPGRSPAFVSEKETLLDPGTFYAPQCFQDDSGRWIMFGWINCHRKDRPWNGSMTLPRVLSVAEDGTVLQAPAPELEALRKEHVSIADFDVEGILPIADIQGEALEIIMTFTRTGSEAAGIRVACDADATDGVDIVVQDCDVIVDGVTMPGVLPEDEETATVRIFLDRAILEVYCEGMCVSKEIDYTPGQTGVAVFSPVEPCHVCSIDAWTMGSAWSE